jgi:hypothetical protein
MFVRRSIGQIVPAKTGFMFCSAPVKRRPAYDQEKGPASVLPAEPVEGWNSPRGSGANYSLHDSQPPFWGGRQVTARASAGGPGALSVSGLRSDYPTERPSGIADDKITKGSAALDGRIIVVTDAVRPEPSIVDRLNLSEVFKQSDNAGYSCRVYPAEIYSGVFVEVGQAVFLS